jgi:hypothetical protein
VRERKREERERERERERENRTERSIKNMVTSACISATQMNKC